MSFVPAFRQTKTAGFGLAAAVALTLVWSCSSDDPTSTTPDTTPASVTQVTGTNNQTATVNAEVGTPPSVTVTNAAGTGLSGVSVTFAVTVGNGSVAGSPAATNANGIAAVTDWTLGTTAGNNTMTATVGSIVTTFNATGTAGAATTMTISAGEGQSAPIGMAVGIDPAVLVTDQFANPVSGVSVTFTPNDDGQASGSPATTDASGIAAVGWTLATGSGNPVLAIVQGNDQTGPITGPLPTNPTVRITELNTLVARASGVTDVTFNATSTQPGISVSFTPRSGEGSVNNATVVTDVNGDATVQWTPGRTGSNFMDVVAGSASTQFFSIGSNSFYHVELRFLSPATTTMVHKQTFGDAAARWMSIIVGNTPGADLTNNPFRAAGCFGMPHPQVQEVIDDMIIFVELVPIDGVNGVLGGAGPCGRFVGAPIPLIGGMTFDTDDLPNLIANGIFDDVILHEMGHVFGIGTLWNTTDLPALLAAPSCPANPGADTHFTGAAALAEFAVITGGPWTGTAPTTSPVPISNNVPATCPGSRDGHWREPTFDSELMTPFVSFTGNPLSRTTIASVQDLGYAVDLSQADPYTLFSTTALRALTQGDVYLGDDIARGPTILFLPGGGYRVEIVR